MQASKEIHDDLTSIVPVEAYLFFPKDADISHMAGSNVHRIIFEGNVQYADVEKKYITDFKDELQKKYKCVLPDYWTDAITLRFLQATQFKFKNTVKAIQEYITWRTQKIPVSLTPIIQEYLQKGIVYLHGRDHRMRPIIVMNGHLIDPKRIDIDIFIDSLTFILEYVVNKLFLPGQIENWVVLGDLRGLGISDLPIPALKRVFKYLQNNYRARLHKIYVVNTPNTLVFTWKIARGFIEDATRQKLNFFKNYTDDELWQEINSSQVEERFGGKAPNLTSFWPPTVTSRDFDAKKEGLKERLVTREQYSEMLDENQLVGHRIDFTLIQPVQNEARLPTMGLRRSLSNVSLSLNKAKSKEDEEEEEFSIKDIDELKVTNQTSLKMFQVRSPQKRRKVNGRSASEFRPKKLHMYD